MEENSTTGELFKLPKDTQILDPMKAIRAKCIDCCGGEGQEGVMSDVRYCPCIDCAVWPYRFGSNPKNNKLSAKLVFEP